MTSDRSYRKALPEKEALRRLREASGTQFDSGVVEAFLAALVKGLITSS
jgi:HD-GYP domain-containing protein (c-di-GMP phosphodiesterase class II)